MHHLTFRLRVAVSPIDGYNLGMTPDAPERRPLLSPITDTIVVLGDWTLFASRAVSGIFHRSFRAREFLKLAFEVGYASAAVVGVTGLFIGMTLAVQTYGQFRTIGLETSLGAVIHMSVVRELGPVLAAVMLAGRVGSAMAAELATMRVTEQLDALACLGVDPVKHLVAPRVLACVLMLPLLTVLADVLGLFGSTFVCIQIYGIDAFHYWQHTQQFVKVWDVATGLAKSVMFGFVISLIACHRGFHGRAGAEGVGRAATEAFVWSFIAILIIDFFLAMLANGVHTLLWPDAAPQVA